MPRFAIVKETEIKRSARVMQLEGMFDIPPDKTSRVEISGSIDLEEFPWSIGLIMGSSGSGKTTIARELFGANIIDEYPWPEDRSLVDAFPRGMSIKDIVGALSSVGFSSPPSWLRPYHVLSNGEKFRATIARAICEGESPIVIDEFTSVVDRTVAKVGSHAIAKAIRKTGKQLIAISCHYDILEWLQPDWTFDTASGEFRRRCLRRRPDIAMRVTRAHRDIWRVFERHHYLSRTLASSAQCFLATIEDQPAAMCGVMSFPHPKNPGWRVTRIVTLPDFQGTGIGSALLDYVASLFAAKKRDFFITTSHPGFTYRLAKSKLWTMIRKPGFTSPVGKTSSEKELAKTAANKRLTSSFKYAGPVNREDANLFEIV